MPELDHLILASPDLEEGVSLIESLTGARAIAGGPHPGMGSHNALLTFDQRTYFEVIAIDPDQPDPNRPRPFGLDDATGPRLAGYAMHPTGGESLEQVADILRASGFDPGETIAMSRVKPDGEEIHWRLTYGGSPASAEGSLPFIIDWGDTPSPAASLPSMGSLVGLRVSHPDEAVRNAIGSLGLGVETDEGAFSLMAVVDSAKGRVEIA
ncbi:MAG: VOC family protein [Actinomycetia bacterium]|nr:VOC family protein [Actinomycetes bacterium]MCP4221958.1 VOC family protein [Actinomycetes bacterium]MCP5035892.1 VOC family protein [Actinomycetes bacterium]